MAAENPSYFQSVPLTENPSYFQSVPLTQEILQKELLFHFYMFQHTEDQPNANQRGIINPRLLYDFGRTAVHDWEIRDGRSINARIVARAQGLHFGAGVNHKNWFICFNIVFTDERFKDSSLKVLGSFEETDDGGEWAIVGGTGEFAFAQGVVAQKWIVSSAGGNAIWDLHIRALCLTFPAPAPVTTKIGPWGGNGGTEFDIPGPGPAAQRLESVTISSGVVIYSIAFSYVDPAGKKQTAGPWGGDGELADTVQFAPAEIVKEVSGTTGIFGGDNVVTSLTFVTNVRTYGPFGEAKGTAFSVPLMDTNVVGFFARAGKLVHALGVYARPSIPS